MQWPKQIFLSFFALDIDEYIAVDNRVVDRNFVTAADTAAHKIGYIAVVVVVVADKVAGIVDVVTVQANLAVFHMLSSI